MKARLTTIAICFALVSPISAKPRENVITEVISTHSNVYKEMSNGMIQTMFAYGDSITVRDSEGRHVVYECHDQIERCRIYEPGTPLTGQQLNKDIWLITGGERKPVHYLIKSRW